MFKNPLKISAVFGLTFLMMSGVLNADMKGKQPEKKNQKIRVAAASNLKFAFDEIAEGFRKEHPHIDLQVTYGSSGNFYSQIQNKAPFDLFLSADVAYPKRLAKEGYGQKDSEFIYALGRIVVWIPKESKLDLSKPAMSLLTEKGARKIAIANPKLAPYGVAAEEAMKKSGIYDQVKDKLVFGENVAQTAQFVESGAADIGIIPLSLALSPNLREKGQYWEVDRDAYAQIEQGGIILKSAQDLKAVRKLTSYIRGEQGKGILERYGYSIPSDSRWIGKR